MTSALVESLRALPDDWGAWLVLADALTEAGDDRGALLVRESRGQDIAADAAAWLETWSAYLAEEDAQVAARLVRYPALAARAHADIAPVFARPVSQWLALLELTDDPPPELSPLLAILRDRKLAATVTLIDRAFDGVPVPDARHRTIHQAEAADSHDMCDRSRDHLGRWQDLPDAHLLDNQWALAHLDDQGIHYYLPAVMTFALRHFHRPHARDQWITESLGYTLHQSKGELHDYQQRRFACLDRDQRAAIYAFVLATGTPKMIAAWGRVFEAERAGPRADWYAVYRG